MNLLNTKFYQYLNLKFPDLTTKLVIEHSLIESMLLHGPCAESFYRTPRREKLTSGEGEKDYSSVSLSLLGNRTY